MVSSTSRQDEPNCTRWLATRAGKVEHLLRTTRCIPQEKFLQKPHNKSSLFFFSSLWTLTSSQSINTQKKNSANIQPSWPHNWSITRIYWHSLYKCMCTGNMITSPYRFVIHHMGPMVYYFLHWVRILKGHKSKAPLWMKVKWHEVALAKQQNNLPVLLY